MCVYCVYLLYTYKYAHACIFIYLFNVCVYLPNKCTHTCILSKQFFYILDAINHDE